MSDKSDKTTEMLTMMMAASTLKMMTLGLHIVQSRIIDREIMSSYMDRLIPLSDELELDTKPERIKELAEQARVIVEEVYNLPVSVARNWGGIIEAALPNFAHILKGGDDGFDRDNFREIIQCVDGIIRDMTPIALDTDDDESVIKAINGWDKGSAVKQALHQLDVSATQLVLGVLTIDQVVAAGNTAKDKALAAMQVIAL